MTDNRENKHKMQKIGNSTKQNDFSASFSGLLSLSSPISSPLLSPFSSVLLPVFSSTPSRFRLFFRAFASRKFCATALGVLVISFALAFALSFLPPFGHTQAWATESSHAESTHVESSHAESSQHQTVNAELASTNSESSASGTNSANSTQASSGNSTQASLENGAQASSNNSAQNLPENNSQVSPENNLKASPNNTSQTSPDSTYTGFFTGDDGVRHWYDNGTIAADKAFYDPDTNAWYWADADGTIATNKDVFIPVSNEDRSSGKWVRCDEQSRFVKGQDYRYGGWYYFDETTAEMTKGFRYIWADGEGKWVCYDQNTGQMYHGQANDSGNWYYFDDYTGATQYGFRYIPEDNKWVFYDRITGIMQYGEQYIDDGWYYLTPYTGAVDYGFSYIPTSNKWVYYDLVSGRMIYGQQWIDGKLYYFDEYTGRQYSAGEIISKLISTVQSTYGADLDCAGELRDAGGSVCYEGPCMSYVWWCFWHAGLNQFLCDGAISGWPHDNSNWYEARGRYDMSPRVGDIAFFRYSGWADEIGASTSHAGIVIAVSGASVLVADALDSGIWPRWYTISSCAGFGHPYYD